MIEPTLSAVVIVVPQHERFLKRLLRNLNVTRQRFDEVIVVASGFGHSIARVRKLVSLEYPSAIVLPRPLGSAGSNRNAGVRVASSELVAFLDADDAYALERNEMIRGVFAETKADYFIHSFMPFTDYQSVFSRLENVRSFEAKELLSNDDLLAYTFPEGYRDRSVEISGTAQTTNLMWSREAQSFEVHHAHCTVRRDVFESLEFHEVFGVRNEDGVFARDVLEAGFRVLVSSAVLSGYQQGARAKPRPTIQMGVQKMLSGYRKGRPHSLHDLVRIERSRKEQ